MDFIDVDQPMEAIKEWQDWYRKNPITPEPEPMTDSPDKIKDMWLQKAKEHFADTLCEYQYELSGKDFYKAFYQAAYEIMQSAEKEYEKTKELLDMLRYHHLGQD